MQITDKQIGMIIWKMNNTGLDRLLPKKTEGCGPVEIDYTMARFEIQLKTNFTRETARNLISFLCQYETNANKNSERGIKALLRINKIQ